MAAPSDVKLFLSDLQMPFEHKEALAFCTYVKRHYKIKDENCFCVGDETDQYWGGQWKKDPNALHTATQEITTTQIRMRPWYDVFPELKIAVSNHGTRWQRKAFEADIPELLMRRYESVLGCPPGWRWQKRWLIRTKRPILMEHGDRFGGQFPHVAAASANACNTVIGHHHSRAGTAFTQTNGTLDGCPDEAGYNVWGMVVGSLIDFEKYAFHYAREARNKPKLGVGLVFDSGNIPLWLPLE